MVKKDRYTANITSIQLSLAGILAIRAAAKKKGENPDERTKRLVKEARFRNRVLMDVGTLEKLKWTDELGEKFNLTKRTKPRLELPEFFLNKTIV